MTPKHPPAKPIPYEKVGAYLAAVGLGPKPRSA
jgi:hypothetical protein